MTTSCWNQEQWHDEANEQARASLAVAHAPDCAGVAPAGEYDTYRDSLRRCYCAGVYQCTRCLRYFGWCAGAALGDGRDEWCDECWYESERVAGGT